MFDYIIDGKFISQTHKIEGETPIEGITDDIRKFPKVVDGQVTLDSDSKSVYELGEAKRKKLIEIDRDFENAIKPFLEPYHEYEIKSWPTKAEQALTWKRTPSSQRETVKGKLPLLVSEAGGDNTAIDNLADRIEFNSIEFQTLLGNETRMRHERLEQLEIATTEEEIKAV